MQLILLGGFLGSGKTTAIQQACSALLKQNNKVAVITNDQGKELVDTTFINNFSIPVKEVVNGCFCCNYNDLLQNIYYFSEQINPDIIFAESVGSCTDMIATIARPMAEMHPELSVNISVFVDVYLLHSIIRGTSSFIDGDVRYIFQKQMEEADVLILNKADLVTQDELNEVMKVLRQDYSSKKILLQDSFNEKDIHQWLDTVRAMPALKRTSLDIDYNIYGSGEAKLAWLDAVLFIKTEKLPVVKAGSWLAEIIYEKIKAWQLTTGHLKFLIDDGKTQQKISYTASDQIQRPVFESTTFSATVIINARVQTEPDVIKKIFFEAIDEASLQAKCRIEVQSLSAFKPGFPKPTYRMA
ncbi:MAG TPA: GTP-binding protein [Chitinophagaceae bacterium]|nr:GTP-binding protein [Chitinophagaceae bacterium]